MPPKVSRDQTIEYGAALARSLDQRGWTQARLGAEVARALGEDSPISQGTVSNWVAGINRPVPERVFAIEEVLDLTPGSLSHLLGYVPAHAVHVEGVLAAIDADARLSPVAKKVLKASYAAAVDEEDRPS